MSFGQIAQFKRAELDALDLFHRMAGGKQFTAEGVAASVPEFGFVPRIVGVPLGGGWSPEQTQMGVGGMAELTEQVGAKWTLYLEPIDLGDARRGLHHAVAKLAVGGEQD